MSDHERVDQIRERLNNATPGPWTPDVEVRGDCVVWGPDGQFIANHQAAPHWTPDVNGRKRAVAFDVDRRDCDFIANARTDVEWLLAEVARLRETNTRLNRRVTDAESRRAEKRDQYAAMGIDALVADSLQRRLVRQLDFWERQGHTTVGIAWLRRHFDRKRGKRS